MYSDQTMFILDFDSDSPRAFVHGFIKGLAAPVCLYHSEALPKVRVQHVQPCLSKSAAEAIGTDWARLGSDIRVVTSNEQTRQQTAITQASK